MYDELIFNLNKTMLAAEWIRNGIPVGLVVEADGVIYLRMFDKLDLTRHPIVYHGRTDRGDKQDRGPYLMLPRKEFKTLGNYQEP
jgi:hypothetical protein